MKITLAMLAEHPFLRGLPNPQLNLLLENSMPAEFGADETIFREGQPANRFYLILEGEIALESAPPIRDGDARRIQTVGPGQALGWSWLFSPYYWNFDARALTPVKAIFIYGTRVRELCEDNHDLGYELMKRTAEVVVRRLQAARQQLLEQTPD